MYVVKDIDRILIMNVSLFVWESLTRRFHCTLHTCKHTHTRHVNTQTNRHTPLWEQPLLGQKTWLVGVFVKITILGLNLYNRQYNKQHYYIIAYMYIHLLCTCF